MKFVCAGTSFCQRILCLISTRCTRGTVSYVLLAVWRSGGVVRRINRVTLRRAWIVFWMSDRLRVGTPPYYLS